MKDSRKRVTRKLRLRPTLSLSSSTKLSSRLTLNVSTNSKTKRPELRRLTKPLSKLKLRSNRRTTARPKLRRTTLNRVLLQKGMRRKRKQKR